MDDQSLYQLFLKNPSVQTDTRQLKPGDIFFALKGPHFNGNLFAKQALDAGAAFAVVDQLPPNADERMILVNDSLLALQQLASYHRDQISIPVIAITGSNGKTTTKELVHAVLSSTYKTSTTQGNLNNHIGVPLTILKIKKDAQMAVIEMGANHRGEIQSYCQYAKPNFGLITNIGKAHLEGFGGETGVKLGKGELFQYLAEHDGKAFVNLDDPAIVDLAAQVGKKVVYGRDKAGEKVTILSSDPFLRISIAGERPLQMATQLVGSYNLSNILAAVTIGRYFQVDDDQIKHAIEGYVPANSRSQMVKRDGNTIIMDAYNANPGSMKVAIENMVAMKAGRKVLILGDMKELGSESHKEHQQLIELIRKHEWAAVALTGPVFNSLEHEFRSFDNAEEAKIWFRKSKFHDALILVKGSRSMQMEKVVEP